MSLLRVKPFSRILSITRTLTSVHPPSIPHGPRVYYANTYHHLHTYSTFHSHATLFASPPENEPVVVSEDENVAPPEEEATVLIEEILETRIRPTIVADGGDIHLVGWDAEQSEVVVRLSGACASCDRSTVTMRMLVQNALKYYLPWVARVRREGGEEEHTIKVGEEKNLF